MSSFVPQALLVLGLGQGIDLVSDTLKVMLLRDSYTPNPDHKFVSDIVAHECNATGYAGGYGGAGRKTLASKTLTEETTLNRCVFDAADPSDWTLGGATNNTLLYLAIIKEITNDAASRIVSVNRFETGGTPDPITTNGGAVSIAFAASGIFYTQH